MKQFYVNNYLFSFLMSFEEGNSTRQVGGTFPMVKVFKTLNDPAVLYAQ